MMCAMMRRCCLSRVLSSSSSEAMRSPGAESVSRAMRMREETELWARENKKEARLALLVPDQGDIRPRLDEGIERYAMDRGYRIPQGEPARSQALTLLSHALTFPLTLAFFAETVVPSNRTKRVAVIGARAESSLPLGVWGELQESTRQKWQVLLLGPQAVATRRLGTVTKIRDLSIATKRGTLGVNDDLNAIFHKAHNQEEEDFSEYDVDDRDNLDLVALFNPGLGHPHQEPTWKGGLAAIARARPKAVLVTSFSERDQASDLSGLRRICESMKSLSIEKKPQYQEPEILLEPTLNPYRSRLPYLDPLDATHLTYANERAFLLRLPFS